MLTLSSRSFQDGGEIPLKYTCDGDNISPSLSWTGVPENTKSLVLIVDDPDAPDPAAPRITWVHWLLYNIPPEIHALPEAVTEKVLPTGAEQGQNDWKKIGYGGACPPIGRHRYVHKLYALDTELKGLRKPTKSQLEAAMQGHIIEKTELIGTYKTPR